MTSLRVAHGRNGLPALAAPGGDRRVLRLPATAVLVSCTALVCALVLGTQLRMMSVLGDHHLNNKAGGAHSPLPPGRHHRLAGLKRRASMMAKRDGGAPEGRRRRPGQGTSDGASNSRSGDSQEGGGFETDDPADDQLLLPDAAAPAASGGGARTISIDADALRAIARKWNLTAPNAVDLLGRQFAKENDYDPRTDFFHFHHLHKSGGTTLSNLMDKTIGLPRSDIPKRIGAPRAMNYEGILPGSYESGNFDHDEALADIDRRIASGTRREDLPYRASYAHTGLRPVYGPRRTRTGAFLTEQLPGRRLRAVAMLRDPTDFRASNHAMIMCGLNYEVSRFNRERRERGLEPACSPADGLDLSALVDRKIGDLLEKCRRADEEEARGVTPKLNNALRNQCKNEEKGMDTRSYCRSVGHLLASKQYDQHYRSMFKGLMGRFHRGQDFNNNTAYGRMGYGFERAEESEGYSLQKVEEYTLEDLGGLDTTTISGAGDGVGPPEPDFIWFGITERMKESTTLFYYFFKVKPLQETPIHRVQECRPNSWWSEEDREEIKRREPADYAVWRAANAILDVRMEKMRSEVQALLDAGETRESLFYVDWDQLEEIGFALKDGQLVTSE